MFSYIILPMYRYNFIVVIIIVVHISEKRKPTGDDLDQISLDFDNPVGYYNTWTLYYKYYNKKTTFVFVMRNISICDQSNLFFFLHSMYGVWYRQFLFIYVYNIITCVFNNIVII